MRLIARPRFVGSVLSCKANLNLVKMFLLIVHGIAENDSSKGWVVSVPCSQRNVMLAF